MTLKVAQSKPDQRISEIKLVRQSLGQANCTQCCVAMISNINIQEAYRLFGHPWESSLSEAKHALHLLGIETAPIRHGNTLPNRCIALGKWADEDECHTVVYLDGWYYCPLYGKCRSIKNWELHSYLEVTDVRDSFWPQTQSWEGYRNKVLAEPLPHGYAPYQDC
jgi:hypothetical protein